MPPSTVANERGSKTRDGEKFLLLHQLSITGSRDATTGVLGTTPEIGATRNAINAIKRLGLDIESDAIRALTRSRAPLLNNAADIGKRHKSVIKAGLPKPAKASSGLKTPKVISRPTLNKPVNSGAIEPFTNKKIAKAKTDRVIIAC